CDRMQARIDEYKQRLQTQF
ncbi:MarR family transcriptional regulator, partial [Acinetobacter baumannii]